MLNIYMLLSSLNADFSGRVVLLEQTAIDFSYSKQRRCISCSHDIFSGSQALGSFPRPTTG